MGGLRNPKLKPILCDDLFTCDLRIVAKKWTTAAAAGGSVAVRLCATMTVVTPGTVSSKVFFCFVAFIARPQKVGKNPALCAPPPRHSTTTLARKAAIVAPSGYLELKHHTRWPPTLVSPASRAASILPAHIQFNYCKCFAAPPNTTHHIKAPSHPLFEASLRFRWDRHWHYRRAHIS